LEVEYKQEEMKLKQEQTKADAAQMIAGYIQYRMVHKQLHGFPKLSGTVGVMPDEFYQELQASYRKKFA
jgi:hypothetical protein